MNDREIEERVNEYTKELSDLIARRERASRLVAVTNSLATVGFIAYFALFLAGLVFDGNESLDIALVIASLSLVVLVVAELLARVKRRQAFDRLQSAIRRGCTFDLDEHRVLDES